MQLILDYDKLCRAALQKGAGAQDLFTIGAREAIRLENRSLEVVIIPEIGRIASIQPTLAENIMRLDTDLIGRFLAGGNGGNWNNFGGDWLWPVAQSRWHTFNNNTNWPPPAILETGRWQCVAWQSLDGSQSCRMTRDYGEPLNLRVTRLARLHADQPILTIHQQVERTAESEIPATLWNISQIPGVTHAILPTDADSAFPSGYKVLDFIPPAPEQVSLCDQAAVFQVAQASEHKLSSDSKRSWIGVQRAPYLIVESVVNPELPDPFPDFGSRVELYANSGLGYTEIETLAPEVFLKPGEKLENRLQIMVLRSEKSYEGCELADTIRLRIGEKLPQEVSSDK